MVAPEDAHVRLVEGDPLPEQPVEHVRGPLDPVHGRPGRRTVLDAGDRRPHALGRGADGLRRDQRRGRGARLRRDHPGVAGVGRGEGHRAVEDRVEGTAAVLYRLLWGRADVDAADVLLAGDEQRVRRFLASRLTP
jgi:hypothetical protein